MQISELLLLKLQIFRKPTRFLLFRLHRNKVGLIRTLLGHALLVAQATRQAFSARNAECAVVNLAFSYLARGLSPGFFCFRPFAAFAFLSHGFLINVRSA